MELADGGRLAVEDAVTGEVFAAFPTSPVVLFSIKPEGSPRNVWPVMPAGMVRCGDRVRVELAGHRRYWRT